MKGTCSKCKKNKATMTYQGGVYCPEHAPLLEKSEKGIGVGFRYRETTHGRELKGKKSDLSRKSTHKMRSSMGMNYNWRRITK